MAPVVQDRLEIMKTRNTWNVLASEFAKNTFNPIRSIVEGMELSPNPEKPMIALSIGDPTVFGNLSPPTEAVEAIKDALTCKMHCGYGPSVGHVDARAAVAEFCSVEGTPLEAKDVILCSGCSHSLELSIAVLANPGHNILVPRPGFPIYKTLAEGFGITCKYYNLIPDRNWEIDLDHLESLIDVNTRAIVVNNPSNPCGSVFSKHHLIDILQLAERNYVTIIADEIYDYFVFPGQTFHPLASLTSEVPILSCGGLTKRFMVPGWRMGWILIQDKKNHLHQVRKGLLNLSQRIIGSNTLVQTALPTILRKTPPGFYENSIRIVKENAELSFELLSKITGLKPIMPQGAMYMMIAIDMARFPDFKSDLEFCEQLVSEESVFCLPGRCFDYPNYVRIVLTVPYDLMKEACSRLAEFCYRHYRLPVKTNLLVEAELLQERALVNGNDHDLMQVETADCSDNS